MCLAMPWMCKNSSNLLEVYSLPLLDLNTLILCSDCLSTKAFHSTNFSNTSLLDFSTYTHTFLEKSSMKVRKYLPPPIDVVLIGPHTSKCTSSNTLVARVPPSLEKGCLACFPLTHPSQANGTTLDGTLPRPMPLTMFWSALTPVCIEMAKSLVPKLHGVSDSSCVSQSAYFSPIHLLQLKLVQVGLH